MPNYAVLYAPTLNQVAPPNTQNTGSWYIGNQTTGGPFNQQILIQNAPTTSSYFVGSPVSGSAYIIALPASMSAALRPAGQSALTWPDDMPCPQFFYSLVAGSPTLNDAAFINTTDYLLKNYSTDGFPVDPGTHEPADPTGCNSVGTCTSKIGIAGWFHNYTLAI